MEVNEEEKKETYDLCLRAVCFARTCVPGFAFVRGLSPARPGQPRLGMTLAPLLWLHGEYIIGSNCLGVRVRHLSLSLFIIFKPRVE